MESRYLDYLMENRALESEYYSESSYNQTNQTGGAEEDRPTGGFPPIYFCTKEDEIERTTDITSDKKREVATPKSTVSIRDILAKRKKVVAFV